MGEVEGRIYTGWQIIDAVPFEARLERHGLDYGYTNDPSSIVDVYYHNGGYIWDEVLYRKGMTNKHLADVMLLNHPEVLTIGDSAEPKSNDELKSYGVNILGSQKGPGSVLQGIQYVQGQKISVTKRSVNLIKEYRNYLWLTDKEGKVINQPQGFMDHALTAGRYAMESLRPVDSGQIEEAREAVKTIMDQMAGL